MQITRRHFTALLGLSGIGAALPGLALAQEPAQGGTLTVVLTSYPEEGLNPHVRGSVGPTQALRNVYDSLVAADYDESFHPWLAESWTISDDGLVYTFRLRPGVTFTDGAPFNAAAVKTNFDLVTNGAYASGPATTTFASLVETRVIDDLTVELVLERPTADFLHTLSSLQGGFVSPLALEADLDAARAGGLAAPGTGAFILSEIIPGQELILTRNPDYAWGPATADNAGPAHVERLVIKYIREASVRAGLLQSGEVDAIVDIVPQDIALFKDVPGYSYEERGSNVAPPSLYFNTTSAFTSDLRVRRALQTGADVDAAITAILQGVGTRAWSIYQPQSALYDPKYEGAVAFDAEGANALLDEAGWTGRDGDGYRVNADGLRLAPVLIATNPPEPLNTLLIAWQDELRRNLGVEIVLQFRDEGTVDNVREANAYDIFPRSIGGVDPGVILDKVYHSTGAINGPRLADPQIDAWLDEGRHATTLEARRAAYDKVAQFVLVDQAITLPLYLDRHSVAARAGVHDVGAFIDPPRGLYNGFALDAWVDRSA